MFLQKNVFGAHAKAQIPMQHISGKDIVSDEANMQKKS